MKADYSEPSRLGWPGRDIALLLLGALLLFVPSFFTRGLWPPDETRYMSISRAMAANGQYLLLFRNGELYSDKPPLFFWLSAGLYRLGFGIFAARVLAALASTGTALVTYELARRRLSGRAPLLAALVTMTAGLFMITSKVGVLDPLFTFLVTASIVSGLLAMDESDRRAGRLWLSAYLLSGLAVLTKGPVGILLPLLVLGARAGAVGWRRGVPARLHVAGVGLILAIVLVWLVPALLAGGAEYARDLLFRQNLGRMANSFSHRAPVFHYVMWSPVIFLPWSVLGIPALASAIRGWRRGERQAREALAWFGAVFIFFSFISGKRAGYLMPLVPAFGLLMGRYLTEGSLPARAWAVAHRAAVRATLIGLLLVLSVVAGAVWRFDDVVAVLWRDTPPVADGIRAVGRGLRPEFAIFALGGVALLGVVWRFGVVRDRRPAMAAGLAGFTLLASLSVDVMGARRVDPFKSGTDFIKRAAPIAAQADSIYLYRRTYSGMYNLAFHRVDLPVLHDRRQVIAALAQPEKAVLVISRRDLHRAIGGGVPGARVAATGLSGEAVMDLLTNWKAGDAAEEKK